MLRASLINEKLENKDEVELERRKEVSVDGRSEDVFYPANDLLSSLTVIVKYILVDGYRYTSIDKLEMSSICLRLEYCHLQLQSGFHLYVWEECQNKRIFKTMCH